MRVKCCNKWENVLEGIEMDLNAQVIFNEHLGEVFLVIWLVGHLLACLPGSFILSGRDVMLPEEAICYI